MKNEAVIVSSLFKQLLENVSNMLISELKLTSKTFQSSLSNIDVAETINIWKKNFIRKLLNISAKPKHCLMSNIFRLCSHWGWYLRFRAYQFHVKHSVKWNITLALCISVLFHLLWFVFIYVCAVWRMLTKVIWHCA